MARSPLVRGSAGRYAAMPRWAGFTLVELMVAMAIGMVVILALATLFLSTSRTNTELARTNRIIENGRFAIQLIESDLVHAGFWGDYVPDFDNLTFTALPPSDLPADIPDPCLAYASWPTGAARTTLNTQLIGIPVQAYDAVPPGCSALVANKQADTDVIVVRHAETCVPGQGNCDPDTAGRLYFQSSLCADDGEAYVLDTAGFGLRRRDCGATLADKRRFISNIYYVRDFARTAGDGVPTLVRVRFDTTGFVTEPLIEGIEAFRVELGIDDRSVSGDSVDYTQPIAWPNAASMTSPTNRGDGTPDGYRRCTTASACTADELVNVVAAKLFVLARTTEGSAGYQDGKTYLLGTIPESGLPPSDISYGPFNDRFKRHVFSTTVRLHNVSGRRETPP